MIPEMDAVSVITVSSTSSCAVTLEYSDALSWFSLASLNTEHQLVAISKQTQTDELDTDTVSQKVRNWMDTCVQCELRENNNDNGNPNTTCIRYDFDKTPRAPSAPISSFNQTTTLFSYIKESKAKSTCGVRVNGHKKTDDYGTPLSQETQKKELCSYLQLMKPGEKKESPLVKHRRSVRVKNQKQAIASKLQKGRFTEFTDYENAIHQIVDYPTLNSLEDLNARLNGFAKPFDKVKSSNKSFPLPPRSVYEKVADFEDSMGEFIKDAPKPKPPNGCLKQTDKKAIRAKKPRCALPQYSYKYINKYVDSLRSSGRLKSVSMNKSNFLTRRLRKNARTKLLNEFAARTRQQNAANKKPSENRAVAQCEIVSVRYNSDDDIDLQNFIDDMLEVEIMSEEHRKNVIESRILSSSSIKNLINKRKTPEPDVQRAFKIFSDLSKSSEEKENATRELVICEHSYANVSKEMPATGGDVSYANVSKEMPVTSGDDEEGTESADSLSPVPISNLEVVPMNSNVKVQSLHRSLTPHPKRKVFPNDDGLNPDNMKSNHSISLSKMDGSVLRAFYQDYTLVIAQQNCVSFWTQSALGNVLGAQDMWIPTGKTQRIPSNSTYTQKDAVQMVITNETSVAYVELWTKEHKSELREVPLADVFATVYFWRLGQCGLDKKALQLENIKGCAADVQYCVLRSYAKIVVSWRSVQGNDKRTKIHSYHLAADFQTVASISEIEQVEHYVSSWHNIEDCDNLVMGCGENKLTLWNIDYGYVVATITLTSVEPPMSTQWVKCDRGFLFTIQEFAEQELRLVAINGMNYSSKKLQNYNPTPEFNRLKGVFIENGIVLAYYSQGILCWNAQTGELILEEASVDCEYIPCGNYVIMIDNDSFVVKHSLSHLILDNENV